MTAHRRNDEVSVDELAGRAADGDREALSALVRELQHPMYRLALRFLGDPDDAQDACQEILIRIVTRLGTFEGRSKFTTWAYSVATRHHRNRRRPLRCFLWTDWRDTPSASAIACQDQP